MAEFSAHIVGAGRGGTSLLFGLLDSHPECEIVAERFSFNHLAGNGAPPFDAADTLAQRTSRRIDAFLKACAGAARESKARVWGHKTTTEQVMALHAPEFPHPAGFVPEREFVSRTRHVPTIFITRDGRTCIPSKMRRTSQSLDTAIARWRFSIALLQLYQQIHPHLLVVKMETLVAAPKPTLTEICAFLALEYDDQMLAGTNSPKMPAEYRRPHFDAAAVRVTENPPWIDEIASELERAGYAVG